MPQTSPTQAWTALQEGNERFVAGKPEYPNQTLDRRASLAEGQQPIAAVFGCSDSRLPAELVFDQGLGDIFVVRTAGQAIDAAVLGSLEYAVAVLKVPLVVVLGHSSCGAVKATISAIEDGAVPPGFIRDVVEKVAPTILLGRRDGLKSADEFEERHVRETVSQLVERSSIIAERVEDGSLSIVGAVYKLADGKAEQVESVGEKAGANL